MDISASKFAACFTLHAAIQTSVLTVVPLKAYELLGDLKLVSVLFFAAGFMTVVGRLVVPVMIRSFSHRQVLIGGVITAFLGVPYGGMGI